MLKDINPGKFYEGKLQIAKGRITSDNVFYFTEFDGVNGKEPSLWKLNLNTLSTSDKFLKILTEANIFPNPVEDVLNVGLDNLEINEAVVYNSLGKKVLSSSSKEKDIKQINLSKLKTGLYFIRLKSDDNTFIKKIVKK